MMNFQLQKLDMKQDSNQDIIQRRKLWSLLYMSLIPMLNIVTD